MNRFRRSVFAAVLFIWVLDIVHAAEQSKQVESRSTGMFQVNVVNNYISLNADEAPLAQIFNEIARQSGITIDSNIGPEEKITKRLDRVPLEDGISQLAKNVSFFYAEDARTNTRHIARVVVLSEAKGMSGQTKMGSQPGKASEPATKPAKDSKPQQPAPFRFEFNPSNSAEKKGTMQKQP